MLKEFSALLLEFNLVSPLWFPPVLSLESLGSFRLSFCIPGLAAAAISLLNLASVQASRGSWNRALRSLCFWGENGGRVRQAASEETHMGERSRLCNVFTYSHEISL